MFNKIRQEHIDDKQKRIIASAQAVHHPEQVNLLKVANIKNQGNKSTGCQKPKGGTNLAKSADRHISQPLNS